jgi:hypothetical protein
MAEHIAQGANTRPPGFRAKSLSLRPELGCGLADALKAPLNSIVDGSILFKYSHVVDLADVEIDALNVGENVFEALTRGL